MWGLLQGENSFSFCAWWNVTTRSAIKNPVCIRRFFCRPKPSLCLLLFTISIIPRSSAWIMVFCYLWQSEPPLWRWWLSLNAACSFLPRFFFCLNTLFLPESQLPPPLPPSFIFASLSHTHPHISGSMGDFLKEAFPSLPQLTPACLIHLQSQQNDSLISRTQL